MLRHKTLAITADTYTSVIPEVARAAAEAAATIVPRRIMPKDVGGAASTSLARSRKQTRSLTARSKKGQVRTGAPPGTRTPNPRIKSPLFGSILLLYLVPGCAGMCRPVRLTASAAGRGCRVLPGRTGTSEQTWSKRGTPKV
jgi:hypothetical protein